MLIFGEIIIILRFINNFQLFISNKKLQIEFLGPDKYSFRVVGILYIVNNKINNKVEKRNISFSGKEFLSFNPDNIIEKLNVNQWMIENNYAIEYDGKKKKNHIWK